MKKVLIIAYYFPPLGGGGVQRTIKFVKYLRQFGYEPVIFTVVNSNDPSMDDTLNKDIPVGTKIYRGSDKGWGSTIDKLLPLKILKEIWSVLYYLLAIPDEQISWFSNNKKQVEDIIKKENINLIYTTASPYSGNLFGLHLKKKIPKIIWLTDFRDAWVTNPGRYLNSVLRFFFLFRNRIEEGIERKVMDAADMIVTASEGITEDFVARHKKQNESHKFHTITNGFDPDDFGELKVELNDKFILTYYGTFSQFQHPKYFFEAFTIFYKQLNEEDRKSIFLNFIGKTRYNKETEAFITECDLQNNMRFESYMPHDYVIKMGKNSSLLLLFIGKGYYTDVIYTGKIFEYLYIDVPILAMVPKTSRAAHLINETKTGVVADFDNTSEIIEALKTSFHLWKNKQLDTHYKNQRDEKLIKDYSREKLTERLAKLFDQLSKKAG